MLMTHCRAAKMTFAPSYCGDARSLVSPRRMKPRSMHRGALKLTPGSYRCAMKMTVAFACLSRLQLIRRDDRSEMALRGVRLGSGELTAATGAVWRASLQHGRERLSRVFVLNRCLSATQ